MEIQILSEIVFSFSPLINIVIYNGRVGHLRGESPASCSTWCCGQSEMYNNTPGMEGIIYYLVFHVHVLKEKAMCINSAGKRDVHYVQDGAFEQSSGGE